MLRHTIHTVADIMVTLTVQCLAEEVFVEIAESNDSPDFPPKSNNVSCDKSKFEILILKKSQCTWNLLDLDLLDSNCDTYTYS